MSLQSAMLIVSVLALLTQMADLVVDLLHRNIERSKRDAPNDAEASSERQASPESEEKDGE
jgi:hypothetical protein